MVKARRQSILLMVICSVLWSIAGVLIKALPWNPIVIAGLRSLLAAGVMLVYIRASGTKIRLNRYSALSGATLAAQLFLFVAANKLTTAANAIVLQYSAPAFILIFSALYFRQRFYPADLITVAATMGGIAMFFFDRLSAGSLLGNCIALLSGVLLAVNYIISGRSDADSRMSGILFAHLATAAIGVPMIFAFPVSFTLPAAAGILALGIFQLGIPYVLFGLALKNTPPLACSLIGALEPLLNPVWVFLFYGEAPGAFALFGGGVVLVSVTGWCVWRDRFVAANREREENRES